MFDLSVLIDDFINKETSSPQTAKTYFNRLDNFERFLYQLDVFLIDKRITENHIKQFLSPFVHEARTYNLTLVVIHRFCNFLVKEGVIDSNPCENIDRIREKKTIPEAFTKEEVEALFSKIQKIDVRMAAILMLYGGLRITEALHTRKKDIYAEDNTVFIRVKGKGNKDRTTYIINDDIAKEIVAHIKDLQADAPLARVSFPALQKWGRVKMQGVIINFRWHRLRKTFATWLAERGMAFEQIQCTLGHESPSTTEIYTKHVLNKSKLVKV